MFGCWTRLARQVAAASIVAGVALGPAAAHAATATVAPIATGDDGTGKEVTVAIDPTGARIVAAFNQDAPGGRAWSTPATVPFAWNSFALTGSGRFTQQAFDAWTAPANLPLNLFLVQSFQSADRSEARAAVYKTTDGGANWTLFFQPSQGGIQQRPMLDVDRTDIRGGGALASVPHDGYVYLTFDVGTAVTGRYDGSFLQVLKPDGTSAQQQLEIPSDATNGVGAAFQPVAGIADGVVLLAGRGFDGNNVVYRFRSWDGVSTTVAVDATTITVPAIGQKLGSTAHRGFNGHRMDGYGVLGIDRFTSFRGRQYFLGSRNPNPGDTAKNQGDLVLFGRAAGATDWTELGIVPDSDGTNGAHVRSKFFPMMEVDDQGVVHVAFYQNTDKPNCAGLKDGEQCAADVYYSSFDPGTNEWRLPLKLSDANSRVVYTKAAQDLAAGNDYQLLGDYQRMAVTGKDTAKRVVVCWTGLQGVTTRVQCAAIAQPACGDGQQSTAAGESCDDGNDSDEDCCSPQCLPKAEGSSCEAQSRCVPRGTCDANASCVAGCFLQPADAQSVLDCSTPACAGGFGDACQPFSQVALTCTPQSRAAKVQKHTGRATELLTRASSLAAGHRRDRLLQRALHQAAIADRVAALAQCTSDATPLAVLDRLACLRDRTVCALYALPEGTP